MIEFENPSGHSIVLAGLDGRQVHFRKFEKRLLDEWYRRYVPRYLRISKVVSAPQAIVPSRRAQPTRRPMKVNPRPAQRPPRVIPVDKRRLMRQARHAVVGRTQRRGAEASKYFADFLVNNKVPISNDIGVGILSFNRKGSLDRLVRSIRQFTNLNATTIFISDESTDSATKEYVRSIKDMVVVDNSERLGIAGNTNRLLRCLERFRYKILLNDDVEIVKQGWESIYVHSIQKTGFHHFCMRQPGVYGAEATDGRTKDVNGIQVWTIQEKPHGAVMAFDTVAQEKVGYFDESFGLYGMEHVDWSNRVAMAGIQPAGFHDVIGSVDFFRIHKEQSAVGDRGAHLAKAKEAFGRVRGDTSRIRVEPTPRSEVPKVSYVVPFRGQDRSGAIKVVLQCIKAQLFPAIEIIMVEQDNNTMVTLPEFQSIKYLLASGDKPFEKAKAFNLGVSKATSQKIILHDADMLVQADYTKQMSGLLDYHEAVHIGKTVIYLTSESTNEAISKNMLFGHMPCERNVGYFEGGSLGCTREAYKRCGGFHEGFVGYGCEDCEFYERLMENSRSFTERSVDLIHLWHGRTGGWKQCHEANKHIHKQLRRMTKERRIAHVGAVLAKYGF